MFEVLDDRAVGLGDRTATASLATNATGIEWRCGEVLQAGDNAFTRDSGDLCHRRDASPTRGPRLARREQALPTLVPLRAVRLPPHANRPSVDHATRLANARSLGNPPESIRRTRFHAHRSGEVRTVPVSLRKLRLQQRGCRFDVRR